MAQEDRSDATDRQQAIDRYFGAEPVQGIAVVDGFHALKHALRFGAEVLAVAALDLSALARLAGELAPDVAGRLAALAAEVPASRYRELSPSTHPTGVVGAARIPDWRAEDVLQHSGAPPVVLLDRPRHHGNLGAAIRVAAAAGAAGVLVTGDLDPWNPAAVRGSAGLHFALPVARASAGLVIGTSAERPGGPGTADQVTADRPLIAVHPGGEPLRPGTIPPRAIIAFGSERRGLDRSVLDGADAVVGIPMRPGVSSLNLATAVAVVLYTEAVR